MDSFYRISIKAIIFNQERDRILICEEADGWWEFPGGGLEYGESVFSCLKRELQEEMGLEVLTVSKLPLACIFDVRNDRVTWYGNICYEVIIKNLEFTQSDECMAIRFVNVDDLSGIRVFQNVPKIVREILCENYES
jgi:8-oxo-dGTP pyrophosphatase MutT (NUDIX family)